MDSHATDTLDPLVYLKPGRASRSGEQTSGTQRPPKGTIPSLEVSDILPDKNYTKTPKRRLGRRDREVEARS